MSIELVVVSVFLLLTLVVGLYVGWRTNTFKQFVVGDKNFRTATLVATTLATCFGGGFLFRDLEHIYTEGLYYGLYAICCNLSYFIISDFMALRMGEFIHHFSIAESMGALFGGPVRIITGLAGILRTAGSIAIQFQIISRVIQLCCSIEGSMSIYMAAVVVILYSAFGGIKAVTFTDVIQFITFSTLFPVLIYLIGSSMKSLTAVTTLFTTHKNYDLRQVIGWHPEFINTLFLILPALVPALHPATIQRIYMAKNVEQVRTFFRYTGMIGTIIRTVVVILGVTLFVQDATLNPKKLVESILIMHPYSWLKSFLCIGLLALAMSTADSNLNTGSVLFTHDVLSYWELVPKKKLVIARLFSLCVGVLALWLAFYEKDLLRLMLLTLSFYSPIVIIPFVMAVFGFRPQPTSVLLGMGAGALTVIAFKNGLGNYLNIQYGVFPAMCMNLLLLVGSHYLLPKLAHTGWVGIKDTVPLLIEQQKKARKREARREAIKNFSLTIYLAGLLPKSARTFIALGSYVLITQYINLFTAPDNVNRLIYVVLLGVGSLLLFYPVLKPSTIKAYHHMIIYNYPLLLFTLFFVSGSYMISMHLYYPVATIMYLTNVLVALLLLPWRMVLVMVLLSLISIQYMASLSSNKLARIAEEWGGIGSFMYTILFFMGIYMVIIWLKKRMAKYKIQLVHVDKKEETQQVDALKNSHYHHHFNRLIQDDLFEEAVIPKIAGELDKIAKDDHMSKGSQATIKHLVDRLNGHKQFIEEWTYYEQYHLTLDDKKIAIKQVINNAMNNFDKVGIQLQIVVYNNTQQEIIHCDPIKIERLLIDSLQFIKNSGVVAPYDIIALHVIDTSIKYSLNESGSFIKIVPALAFIITTSKEAPAVAPIYEEVLDTIVPMVPNDKNDLYKQEIIRIVDAHYGCFFIDKTASAITLQYILPAKVDEIRDKVMNKLPTSPDLASIETIASIQQEQHLEDLLIKETTLKRELIRETIQLIKKCHGDQRRQSGEPFYIHPMSVAELLLMETKDPDAILAALLHDVLEDSKILKSYLQSRYGSAVANIVSTVTNMGDSFRKKKLSKKENEEHLRDFQDIRAVQVKLADRLHNVRTLCFRSIDKQVKVARQSLDFHVPFAESVGVSQLTKELREHCEAILKKYDKEGKKSE